MKLMIAGGGTGGHLFPGIAVAEEFIGRDSGNEVMFVGSESGIEARVVPRLGFNLQLIPAAGVRGMGGMAKIRGAIKFLYAYSQSRKILKAFKPDMVLGVGGYASGAVVLAARGLQIPRFIHEQNAIPGLTNKALARFADEVFISLEESRRFFPEHALLTGNPLRKQILAEVGRKEQPFSGDRRLKVLVFGGSAGAHSINMAMVSALQHLEAIRERLEITHQTGVKDVEEVRRAYRAAHFEANVIPFIENMASAYHEADLVVCRAGATTIAEVTACGKCCIFIPFPHAVDDHQRRNAEALLKEGAAFMLLEQELSGQRLAEEIAGLLSASRKLEETGEAARRLARLDAAKVIVDTMMARVLQ